MSPNVHFDLTHDGYDRFAELLAPHGIQVSDKSRDILEELPSGAVTIHSHAGVLHFRGHEFYYRRQKDSTGGHVEITHTDTDSAILNALFDVLEQVFPPPKPPRPTPIHLIPWYRQAGCLIPLLVVALVCFFLFLGIRAFFHWL